MKMQSPILKALLFVFATLGLMTVIGVIAMIFMHSSMMSMMGSPAEMADACKIMMGRLL